MSGDEWPRLTEPTPIDHLISSLNYTAARMRHVQTGPSKGLFQFIPSRFQKGAPTMDASQKHHSDILDTLSDYLTRPEVTKITLDRDDVTDTWGVTARIQVDPAHEARKLEDEMMEAVTMTTGATIPDRSSTLIGTEFGEPSGPSDSMAVEFTDRDALNKAAPGPWTYEDMPHCINDSTAGLLSSNLELSRGQRENLAKYLNERSGALNGGKCCEEAQLTANELARRNEELSEAEAEIAAQKERVTLLSAERDALQRCLDSWRVSAEKAEAERDKLKQELSDVLEVSSKQYNELQRKLNAAEGWPEWMGPAPTREELGEIEVTKSSRGYWAQGVRVAEPETKPEDLRLSNIVNDSISSCIRREAVARFIEDEQAATGDKEQRVEEAAKELYNMTDKFGVQFDQSNSQYKDWCYAVVKAGWTPPESEGGNE